MGDNSTYHFIPGIGIYDLNIEKAKPVKILYDFLDEVGEIDRLKNLDHLGDVREVIDGARHSRFDYIALIFALIDNWDQKVREIHAFSEVSVEPEPEQGEEVKGKDLIKCWTLLFNVGHLEWTFFTERILLEVLRERKLHMKLIESIEDEKIERLAKEIFELRDYNHLYQILAYLRFKCLYKKHRDKMDENWFKRYKWMFKKYIFDDFSDKLKESNTIYLKDLYRTVRKIAFLLLDSFYTPSGLNLSPVLLFDNPELIRSIFFGETEISNTLKFLNRQLYKSVYLSERVLAIQSLYYKPLKEKLAELTKKVEGSKNEENICDLIEKIYKELNIKKLRERYRKKKSEYVPIMRFEFEDDDLSEQLKERLDKSSLVLAERNSNCYRVVWKTPLNFYVIQYNSKFDRQSSIATFKQSFDIAKEFLNGIKYKDIGVSYIEYKKEAIERIAKKYIEQALKLFFNNDIRWEWKHTSFLRSYFNFPDAVMGFADDVYKFYRDIIQTFEEKYNKKSKISELYKEKMESILKELNAKLKVVEILKKEEDSRKREKSREAEQSILCITISNLIAYSGKKQQSAGQLMEIDGLILGLTTEKQLFICLIEAKSGNDDAVEDMTSKIRRRENDIFKGYDISNLINSVKGLDDNSIAYLIITEEEIPTIQGNCSENNIS